MENKTKNMCKNVQSIDNEISEKLNMVLEGQKKWELTRLNKYNNKEQKTEQNIIACYHCKNWGILIITVFSQHQKINKRFRTI
jgi:hypothetical protein